MRFRVCGLAIVVAAGMAAAPLLAQQAQPVPLVQNAPFLVLDQERLYKQSAFGRRVNADLKAQADALSAENLRIDAALSDEERRLTDDRATMEPAEFRKLAVDFDERVTAIRQAQANKQADIQRREEAERVRFFELVYPVLLALVQETGAVAVLNRNSIVFSVVNIDVTDTAIARVNAQIGEATPAPEPGRLPVQRP